MNRLSLSTVAALFVLAAAPAQAQLVVYDNFTTPLNKYLDEGTLESGDEVTLAIAGPTTTIDNFTFEYWLDPAKATGTETVRIRFYELVSGAPASTPLYDSQPVALTQTSVARLTLQNLNITAPQTFVWTAQFGGGNISGGLVAGLTLYDPPTTGSSTYEFWQKVGGVWDTYYFDPHPTNFGAEFTAVPEPWATSAVLLSTAAGTVAFLRRRFVPGLARARPLSS